MRHNPHIMWRHLYSACQKKRKPINQVNLSESCNDLSKKVYNVRKFSYPLSFDTSYKMYRPCMANYKQEPFQLVMSKLICAE